MNTSESVYDKPLSDTRELNKADFLNRIIAKTIDFIIVVALYELIPKIGFFAGLTYLLIADGLFGGRSPGKKLIGLKVVVRYSDGTMKACGYEESIFRNFPLAAGFILFGIFKMIPLVGWIIASVIVVLVLAFESLVMLGSEEGMRLGDELARTYVVDDRQGGFNVS